MQPYSRRTILMLGTGALLAACAGPRNKNDYVTRGESLPLFPNETPELRGKINKWSRYYQVPSALVHRLAVRESSHRPWVRNGPYYGLLQILPQTARTMGFEGHPDQLLDSDTNLQFGVKYLRGAYLVADGDHDDAIMWYAKGYYYEAKRRGLLVETGLRSA